ncbi:SusC/RagA family TonB-linked outer membrane protein [Neptunitalea lumnitzerae]|uniref:SusC/RagA family TonB-linked outer membrane protein n=1 Tax=Neptunitalea lumnitzerae TaxID=2965509 RepID=A0ABQ5MJN0_9FLAO|nr:SusC/RagA family TonB-linked outer membrane protein [Neptunitalea sp. Y10]GLB49621.1 SusC/RagA family TonB-linked outer membrane protein [Neptunitalea sp. Y10]
MSQKKLRKGIIFLIILLGVTVNAQTATQKTVTGKITDEFGMALAGVNVMVKGQDKRGTTTNFDGEYSISVTSSETLVFSYIGLETIERRVGDQNEIDVVLKESSNELGQVVVVGYTQLKKEHLTGAIETIDVEEVEDLPVSDLSTAIQGRIVGVGVSGGSTRPGSNATISIRNSQSFTKDAADGPLYVIDGVVQMDSQGQNSNELFNTLDSSEIESITFLKDASAAIYGSRAANGVILITTKKGKPGKPRFNYSGSYGTNDETYRSKVLSGYQFAQYYNILNGPNGANATPGEVDRFFSDDELEFFRTHNYDWLEDAWSSSFNMRHTLNVSGGSENAKYYGGMSYYTQDGNLSSLDYDKWTFRSGVDLKVTDNFRAGVQVSGNYSDLTKTFNKIGGENDENDYRNLLLAPQYIPSYVDGNPVRLPGTSSLAQYHYYEIQRLNNLATTNDKLLTVNVFAEYDVPFIKGLKLRGSYNRNMGGSRGTQVGTTYELYEFNGLGTNGHIYEGGSIKNVRTYKNGNRLYYSNSNSLTKQANFTMNYAHDFGQHSINAVFSIERAEAESSQEDVWKENPIPSTNGSFGSAFGSIDGKNASYETGNLSYVARVNYEYNDKYLLEVLYRTDASTKFAPENYWGNFYSLSGGWVISKEDFFKANSVNYLKLRFGYGKLGKDNTRVWLWRQRYTPQNGQGAVFGGNSDGSVAIRMEAAPNRDAVWSDVYQKNIGLDARFLDQRLSTSVNYFHNEEKNGLSERTGNVPITVGGTIAPENFLNYTYFGYEIAIDWNDDITEDMSYGIGARFSWSDNKVKSGNFNDEDILKPWMPKPGESSDNGMWGYDYIGMFKNQADIDSYVAENNIQQVFGVTADNLRPGMLYYRDVRGQYLGNGEFAAPDGIIDENDQVQLSKKKDNHYGFGTTLKFKYKSLSINAVISGSFGGWAEIDGRKAMHQNISRTYQSVPAYWSDIYDPELNPNGKYPNPYWGDVSTTPVSKFWEVSSFRAACRNITLSYKLPEKFADKMNISNCRVNLIALNPFTLYNPYDYKYPEGAFDTYPVLRTFSLGVNFTL